VAACGDDDGGGGAAETTAGAPTSAATSGSGGSDTTAASTMPDDVDPEGILRVPTSLQSVGGAQLDPADTVINSDETWMSMIYGSLLRDTPSGDLEPWLAESVEVVDPQHIKVVIREGITFSDGTPYDAAAVQRGILRNLREPGNAGVEGGRNFAFPHLEDIVVDGPLELTFVLSAPMAGEFLQALAGRESAVPSPKSLDDGLDPSTSPVGAGPYMLEEFRTGELISVRKNPNFFEADQWHLGGIDWINAVGEAAQNGLLSGQLDLGAVSETQSGAFEGNEQFDMATVHRDFDYYVFNFCRTKPPFDDIRVRRAVQKALDREALNQGWLNGKGEVAYGFWPEGHPYFTEDSKQYAEHDPEGARALLAEAGLSEVSFDLVQPFASNPAHARLAEILQAQLAEVGINANIVFTQNYLVEFFQPQKPGALVNTGSRPGSDRVAKLFIEGFQQVLCGASDPQITEWANEIASLDPRDPKVADLYAQIDERMQGEAFTLFLVKVPLFYVWNTDKVGGEPEFTGQKGQLLYETIYVKQ